MQWLAGRFVMIIKEPDYSSSLSSSSDYSFWHSAVATTEPPHALVHERAWGVTRRVVAGETPDG